MADLPELTAQDVQLLDVIRRSGVVRGSVAMRRAGLSPVEMKLAAIRLSNRGWVNAAGDIGDDVMVQYAMFSPDPYKLESIERALRDRQVATAG